MKALEQAIGRGLQNTAVFNYHNSLFYSDRRLNLCKRTKCDTVKQENKCCFHRIILYFVLFFKLNAGRGFHKKAPEEPRRFRGRDDWTRTSDPYVPNVVRYQLRHIPRLRGQKYSLADKKNYLWSRL